MSFQRGALRKVHHKAGDRWMLRYRMTRADGKRLECREFIGLGTRPSHREERPPGNRGETYELRKGGPVKIQRSPRGYWRYLSATQASAALKVTLARPKSRILA